MSFFVSWPYYPISWSITHRHTPTHTHSQAFAAESTLTKGSIYLQKQILCQLRDTTSQNYSLLPVAIDNAIVANSQDCLLFSMLSRAASQQQVVHHKWPPDLLPLRMIRGSKPHSKRRSSYSRFVLSNFMPCAARVLMSVLFFCDLIQIKRTWRYSKTTTCWALVFVFNRFGTLLGEKWPSKVMLYHREICPVSLSVLVEGKRQWSRSITSFSTSSIPWDLMF